MISLNFSQFKSIKSLNLLFILKGEVHLHILLPTPQAKNKQMGPTTEFNLNPQQQEDNGQSSVEDIKTFQHSRNMTGVVGDSKWHDDIKVNELWDKLSVPEQSGTYIWF